MSNYLILPRACDVRAARACLDWKQSVLANKCDVSMVTITNLEKEHTKPKKELLERIAQVFAEEGIYFLQDGGFRVDKNVVTVYEGDECYLKTQEDILNTCATNGEEALFLGVDDKKSSNKIIEKEKQIYEAGILCKYLISYDKDYILGPLEDYRRVESEYFLSQDLIIIYGTKIAFASMVDKDGKAGKIVILNDNSIANQFRRYFYRLWQKGEEVKRSSTKQIFFKKK